MRDDSDLAERAYHAGCELDYLSSLLATIIEQLDTLGDRADPPRQAALTADLARIAADYAGGIGVRLCVRTVRLMVVVDDARGVEVG